VQEIGESINRVWETSKLGGIGRFWLFPIGVFTSFYYRENISIEMVQQIEESTNGVRETSKLGGTGLNWLFAIGVFT
jgi:hypothetical protein